MCAAWRCARDGSREGRDGSGIALVGEMCRITRGRCWWMDACAGMRAGAPQGGGERSRESASVAALCASVWMLLHKSDSLSPRDSRRGAWTLQLGSVGTGDVCHGEVLHVCFVDCGAINLARRYKITERTKLAAAHAAARHRSHESAR